jgi:hypothetical protein
MKHAHNRKSNIGLGRVGMGVAQLMITLPVVSLAVFAAVEYLQPLRGLLYN